MTNEVISLPLSPHLFLWPDFPNSPRASKKLSCLVGNWPHDDIVFVNTVEGNFRIVSMCWLSVKKDNIDSTTMMLCFDKNAIQSQYYNFAAQVFRPSVRLSPICLTVNTLTLIALEKFKTIINSAHVRFQKYPCEKRGFQIVILHISKKNHFIKR